LKLNNFGGIDMEDSKKKVIKIAVVIACVVLAVGITFLTRSKGGSGIEGMQRGEMWWVKCGNPDCGAEYQMDMKDFLEAEQKLVMEGGMGAKPLTCKNCGEQSIYRAIKCPKCGKVFFYGSVRNDYSDRCPECSYSQTEEDRKKP
jgi:hypothetical protein